MEHHSRARESRSGRQARELIQRERRVSMCPACIPTSALLAGGFLTTGGVAALLAKLRLFFKSKRLPAVNFKEET